MRKTAVRLLDLRAYCDADLGLILPSHSNLECTAAMEPCPRHLPAAVTDGGKQTRGGGTCRAFPCSELVVLAGTKPSRS